MKLFVLGYLLLATAVNAQEGSSNPQYQATPQAKWGARFHENKMDGAKMITLQVEAVGNEDNAAFAVRCADKLEALVYTGVITNSGQVRWKVDSSKPIKQVWTESEDNLDLFAPKAKDFLEEVKNADTLYVEFSEFQKAPHTLSFTITGLAKELDKYYECRRFFPQ